jgi:hypothetical protein
MAQSAGVSGQVSYFANGFPVEAATVQLSGPTTATLLTDAAGRFSTASLPAGDWQITPGKSGDVRGAITAIDATRVLQAVVGLTTLTPTEQLACDVNGSGSLSAIDAVFILQYVVGLRSKLPIAETCGTDWAFVPHPAAAPNQGVTAPQPGITACRAGSVSLAGLTDQVAGQDFSAVLFGDCSGNWRPPVTSIPTPSASPSATPSSTITSTTTATASSTATPTPSRTATASFSATRTATASRTATRMATASRTATVTATATVVTTAALPALAGCQMFPADNPWNRDVSADPVDASSATYIARINLNASLVHPDFGSFSGYGIPYVVVPGTQPSVPITFTDYGDESDAGPYPVPANAPVEAGGDRHVLVLDSSACKLYELYNASKDPVGTGWSASSGAIFDLSSNALRPDSWTSADAAGLPILPGLARYDEVASGAIRHALRFTVWRTYRAWVHPATHYGNNSDPSYPPMGTRLRLSASYDVSHFTGQARVILDALKRYGMIVADNGSSWYISGATDPRWDDEDLNQLKTVPGSAFEVVQLGTIYRP